MQDDERVADEGSSEVGSEPATGDVAAEIAGEPTKDDAAGATASQPATAESAGANASESPTDSTAPTDDELAARAEDEAIAEATAAVAAPSSAIGLATAAPATEPGTDVFDMEGSIPSETCPFFRRLGPDGDPGPPTATPDASNRCLAIGEPQPQSLRQQELICLRSAHADCPRYLRGVRAETEPPAPIEITERRIPRATIIASLILVASSAAALTFVIARGGLSLPTGAGASPTAGGAAVASPSAAPATSPAATDVSSGRPATPAPGSQPPPSPTPGTTATAAPTQTPAVTVAPTANPTTGSTPRPSSDRYALLVPCPDRPDCFVYVVRAGDNLRSIANYFGVPYATVLAFNPSISDPTVIKKGDPILLPPPTR